MLSRNVSRIKGIVANRTKCIQIFLIRSVLIQTCLLVYMPS